MFNIGDRVEVDTMGYGTIVNTSNSDDPYKEHIVLYNVKLDETRTVDYICDIIGSERNGCWEFVESRLKILKKFKFILITKPIIIEAINQEQAQVEFVRYLEEEIKIIDFLGEV